MASMSPQTAVIDKRNYPRVHLFRPITLTDQQGTKVKANLRDLSPGGLQAVADCEAAQDFTEALTPDDESFEKRITARFNLPVDDRFFDITIQCRLVYMSEVPDEGVAIGLNFVHCSETDLAHLKRFILCSLEPA